MAGRAVRLLMSASSELAAAKKSEDLRPVRITRRRHVLIITAGQCFEVRSARFRYACQPRWKSRI